MRKLFVTLTMCSMALFAFVIYKKTAVASNDDDTLPMENIYEDSPNEKVSALPMAQPSTVEKTKTIISSAFTSSPTRKKSFDQPYEYFQNRLKFLETCFERRCKLSNKDPKSYEFAVYMEVEKTLFTLKAWQSRHDFKDERIPKLMRTFLSYEKSEIKVAALEILATQDKDERVVPHVLEHVIHQAYPGPISLGMKELARYKDGKYKQKIETSVADALTHGSIYSAVQIAKNIKPIITSQNRETFTSTLDELSQQPLSKEIYTALKDSLGEG